MDAVVCSVFILYAVVYVKIFHSFNPKIPEQSLNNSSQTYANNQKAGEKGFRPKRFSFPLVARF